MMTKDTDGRQSPTELHSAFNAEVASDKRAAAETAYALAFRYRNDDVNGVRRFDLARLWARTAIALLEELPSALLSDVASARSSVGGVPIPNYLHAEVVRERLGDVLN